MTKRIITLLLAALFILSCAVMAGCQNAGNKTEAPKTAETAKETATVKETQPTGKTSPAGESETGKTADETNKTTESSVPTEKSPDDDAEPEYGTQEWLRWLVDVDGLRYDEATYPICLGGGVYTIQHEGAESASPWETLDEGYFHMCYQFDRTEIDASANVGTEDYEYTFEIWYRDAESDGEYKCIHTKPWSVYVWGGDNNDIIYRLPTYDEGMNDMTLPEGETEHEYEFIFIIYKGEEFAPENIAAWKQDWINYTDSTEMFIADAKELGYIS